MAPKNANFSYATPIFSAEDLAATKIVYVVGLGSRLFFEDVEPRMPELEPTRRVRPRRTETNSITILRRETPWWEVRLRLLDYRMTTDIAP
jgi:hypothetical protein